MVTVVNSQLYYVAIESTGSHMPGPVAKHSLQFQAYVLIVCNACRFVVTVRDSRQPIVPHWHLSFDRHFADLAPEHLL